MKHLLSILIFVCLFGMHSCSSENELFQNTEEELQGLEELRVMYSKLKNKDTKPLDDLINKYEKSKLSKQTKSGNFDPTTLEGNKYIERYITEIELSGDQGTTDCEEIAYDYQGSVDYDEIISDLELSIEEKEMLIITFLYLDVVVEDVDQTIDIVDGMSAPNPCLDNYRKELTGIRNKYLGMSVRAWGLYFIGNRQAAVITSAAILRDVFSGKHYMEISAAQGRYEACMGKVYEVVPDTEVPNIDNEEPLLLEKTNPI